MCWLPVKTIRFIRLTLVHVIFNNHHCGGENYCFATSYLVFGDRRSPSRTTYSFLFSFFFLRDLGESSKVMRIAEEVLQFLIV